MPQTRVAIIGCGYWGPKHARNFAELPDAELAWVSDLRSGRLAHMKELYPTIRTTQDYRDILASDAEAVVIATPVATHWRLAMEALRAGKHILVEKPLATSYAEAANIASTADQLGLAAMVGHTFQYNPAVNVVRDLVASGALGRIYYASATRVNLGIFQPDINVVWDLAPHDVSILIHILGVLPIMVSASGQAFVNRERNLHEMAYMTLIFPGGTVAGIRVSWLDPVKQRQLTLVGSRKMLVYDDIASEKVVVYDKGVEVPAYSDTPEQFHLSYRHGEATPVPVAWQEPLRIECQAFLDSIRSGRRPCSDAWMGAEVVRVLEAAQESLMNGGGREMIV